MVQALEDLMAKSEIRCETAIGTVRIVHIVHTPVVAVLVRRPCAHWLVGAHGGTGRFPPNWRELARTPGWRSVVRLARALVIVGRTRPPPNPGVQETQRSRRRCLRSAQ